MAVVKIEKRENPYVQIDHRPLNDDRLSWKAKGLLAYLLSKPADWQIVSEDLIKRSRDGRDAIQAAMKELRDFGYATLETVKTETGVAGKRWTVRELPEILKTGFPVNHDPENRVSPQSGNLTVRKSATSNKDITKKDKTNRENSAESIITSNAVGAEEKIEGFPASIDCPEVRAAWREWLAHRKEIKKPVTLRGAKLQVDDLAEMGAPLAIAAIRHSIKSRYTGIFAPKDFKATSAAQSNGHKPLDDTHYQIHLTDWIREIRDGKTEWEHYRKFFAKAVEVAPSREAVVAWLKTQLPPMQVSELTKEK